MVQEELCLIGKKQSRNGVEVVEQKQSERGLGVMEYSGPKLAWMEEWKVLVF